MNQVHFDWLAAVSRDIQDDYERLHEVALRDPQRSGHGGESSWVQVLCDWLPPTYEVGTRKYSMPEQGEDVRSDAGERAFETDIVVFDPSYPRRTASLAASLLDKAAKGV